jgi:hypothetical protein
MENFRYIDFQRARDFSNKMNATFEFVKQNFKSLWRVMLYLVGPPALIGSLLIGSVMGDYFKALFGSLGGSNGFTEIFTVNVIIKLVLALIVATITSVITMATINNYVILYREKKSNQIEVEEVWERVKKTFWMYFWTVLGWFVLAIAAYIVMIIPFAALGLGSAGLAFILILILICAFFYLVVANSLVFIIRGFESRGFFGSFARSMYLIRGKWWSTFGLFTIFYLIITIISSLFFLPWYFSRVISSLHDVSQGRPVVDLGSDWFGILSTTLQYLTSYLMAVLPQLALIFQYFNLVERKESRGLMEKMGSLGSGENANTNTSAEHY